METTLLSLADIQLGKLQSAIRHRPSGGEDVESLADSMAKVGLLSPIIVRREEDDTYTVLAGARRVEAARSLGWEEIPANVVDFADEASVILTENGERKQLSYSDLALIAKEIRSNGRGRPLSQAKIAEKLRLSQPTVSRLLELADAHPLLLATLDEGLIAPARAVVVQRAIDAVGGKDAPESAVMDILRKATAVPNLESSKAAKGDGSDGSTEDKQEQKKAAKAASKLSKADRNKLEEAILKESKAGFVHLGDEEALLKLVADYQRVYLHSVAAFTLGYDANTPPLTVLAGVTLWAVAHNPWPVGDPNGVFNLFDAAGLLPLPPERRKRKAKSQTAEEAPPEPKPRRTKATAAAEPKVIEDLCPLCAGTTWDPEEPDGVCPNCDGKGTVLRPKPVGRRPAAAAVRRR